MDKQTKSYELTKAQFQKYFRADVSDETAEEIEQNLKFFFSLLLEWTKNKR